MVTGTNPAKNEDSYRSHIKTALKEVIDDLKAEYPDLKVPGADAVKGYTARIVSQLATTEKDYSGGVRATEQEVTSAVEEAEEDGSSEPAESEKEAEIKAPRAAKFMEGAEYEILTPEEMAEVGVELSDDLKTYYSRIENIADQVQTGKALVRTIQRGGTDTGSATKAVSALIRAGAIKYATAENSDQDVEALEREEGDIEEIGRKEFEKSFGKVYKDAMASEPGAMAYNFED